MTTTEQANLEQANLEQGLMSALATVPSRAGLDRLDWRIRDALASPPTRKRFWQRLRGPRLVVVLAAVLIVAVTAAAGGSALIDRFMTKSWWDKAWERSEPIGLSQTVNGERVTVERGYMDAGQIVLGLSATGRVWLASTLRIDGKIAEGASATGNEQHGQSVGGRAWFTPSGVGDEAKLTLDVRAANIPDRDTSGGPWHFEFELPNAGGMTWNGSMVERASGVTVILDGLVVSPTIVSGHVSFRGERVDSVKAPWTPIGVVIHGKNRARLALGRLDDPSGGYSFSTYDGFDAEHGTVTLRIDELLSNGETGALDLRIKGPWVFKVPLGD